MVNVRRGPWSARAVPMGWDDDPGEPPAYPFVPVPLPEEVQLVSYARTYEDVRGPDQAYTPAEDVLDDGPISLFHEEMKGADDRVIVVSTRNRRAHARYRERAKRKLALSIVPRCPAGWTDLPWWKDGQPLEPDLSGQGGEAELVVGEGQPITIARVRTLRDAELREEAEKERPCDREFRELTEEFERRFGHEPASQPVTLESLTVSDPQMCNVVNPMNRTIEARWESYFVPDLERIGVSAGRIDDLGMVYNWFSATVEKDKMKVVRVPAGLVDALGEFWCYKQRDDLNANFLISLDKLTNIMRPLVISEEDSRLAKTYVPLIAFNKFLTEGDHMARLVRGRYITAAAWKYMMLTGGAALAAVPTVSAMVFAGATAAGFVVGGAAAVALAAAAAAISIKMRGRPAAYSRVLASANSLSRKPDKLNDTAEVKMSDAGDKPMDRVRQDAAIVVGVASSTYTPTVFADNVDNQLKALEKRVLAAPPDHDLGTVKDFLAWEKRVRHKVLGKAVRIDSMPFDQWLARMNASVPVKRRLMKAKCALRERGVDEDSLLDPDELYRATSRESFCKFELLLKGTRLKESDSAPRLIQGAHPEMTVTVGPWVAAFQGRMRKVLNGTSGLMFTSGKTVREVGAFIGARIEAGWKPFDDDVGAFDLSIIKPYCQLENEWADFFHAPRLTRQVLRANVDTHGWTSLGWKYRVQATRKSGDSGTSVFNSLLNLLFHLYIFCKERGLDSNIEEAMRQLHMAAQGDDDVGAHTGPTIDWASWMSRLGFKATPHYPEHHANLEFCSHYLTRDSIGWTFKPKVGRILAKMGVSLRATDANALAILRGNALSIQATAASCPPLRAWVDWALNATASSDAIRPHDEPWKMRADEEGEATPETWADLDERYGYTRSMHVKFVEELATCVPGAMVELPIYDHLCGRDTDGEPRDIHSWFGLPVPDHKIGDEVVPDTVQYSVKLPNGETVLVDVPGFDASTVGFIVKRAFRLAGHGDGPNSSEWVVKVAGREVKASFLPLGLDIEVRMRARGGVIISSSVLSSALARLPKVIAAALQDVPASIVGSAIEGAVTYAWDDWAMVDDEKTAGDCFPEAVVNLCGEKKMCVVSSGETYATVLAKSHKVPPSVLLKLIAVFEGKVVAWSDKCAGSFEVRAKGVGGADVTKSERKIAKAIRESGALPSSMGYLWAVLDGMHDHEFPMEGVPDMMIAGSVRQCVRQTITIACPTPLAGANWDCNVVSFPDSLPAIQSVWLASQVVVGGLNVNTNSYTLSPSGSQAIAGGVTAYCTASGAAQALSSATQFIPTVQATKSTTSNRWLANVPGSWREYGRAIEITNSTAPLYQQGECIVWRQPMPSVFESTAVSGWDPTSTGSQGGTASVVRAPAPPESAAEAMQLLGSRQWHSKEGAYLMNMPNGDANPLINGQYMYALYYNTSNNDQGVFGPNWTNQTVIGTVTAPSFSPSAYQPFNMGGAYFVGLSPQTTLTIAIRSYVEIFPSQVGNTLTSLATPSAPYDAVVKRLIAECMKTMPPGVMLCENGFGDWISDVAGKIASFVSPVARVVGQVASFIPHPAAQAVARGAAVAQGMAESFMAPSSAELRGDGVKQAIQREKRMIKSEARVRDTSVAQAEANRRVAERNAATLEKLKSRSAARVAGLKKRK